MDSQVLDQLVQIKWLIAVLAIGVLFLSGIRTWVEVRRTGGPRELLRRGFVARAQSLLEQGRAAELLTLARDRCSDLPGDPYGFWYQAHAAHRIGDIATALQSMETVGQLQPDWRESHVEPFIRALESDSLGDSSALPPTLPSRGPTKPH
jgi:hypothetical protein